MKITLGKLRTLKVQADAVLSQKALGFLADIQVSALGKLAHDRIEYEQDLSRIVTERLDVVRLIQSENQESSDSQLGELILKDPRFIELSKKEEEIWSRQIGDFEVAPVKVIVREDISYKFKDEFLDIPYRGRSYRISPYLAVHEWISEGLIEVEIQAE